MVNPDNKQKDDVRGLPYYYYYRVILFQMSFLAYFMPFEEKIKLKRENRIG
jgi:hypothetical protein